MWLGMPIVIGALMSLHQRRRRSRAQGAAADRRRGSVALSRLVVGGSRQGRLGEFLDVEASTRPRAARRSTRARRARCSRSRRDFRTASCTSSRPRSRSSRIPPQRILPGIIEEGAEDARRGGLLRAAPVRRAAARDRGHACGTATGPSTEARRRDQPRDQRAPAHAAGHALAAGDDARGEDRRRRTRTRELLGAVPPRPAVHVAAVHRAGHEHRHLDREDRRHAAARALDAAAARRRSSPASSPPAS